jgi:hypothetical protein
METFCEIWWEALQDFTLKLLIGCSILSMIIGVAGAEDQQHRELGWI